MQFGILFLTCAIIWCVFQIPFPTALRTGRTRLLVIAGCAALIVGHHIPVRLMEEVLIDPAAVILWGIALACALRFDRGRIWAALLLAVLTGGLLMLLERLQLSANIGLLSGAVASVASLLLWRHTAAAVLCAASAPVFASVFTFLYEWTTVGYSVFNLLPLALFDAQVTAVLLTVLASRAFVARPARAGVRGRE